LPTEIVFAFFADAENLERITPPELAFQILTPMPMKVGEGSIIDYRLKLFGVPFRWRTLIALWQPPFRFVDEQTRGPYHTWTHLHAFESTGDGTRMTDRVEYRLPAYPFSGVVLPLVRCQVARIFEFRALAIHRILVGNTDLAL
jgi:ligand-binding SRPBCC domain-containing protein